MGFVWTLNEVMTKCYGHEFEQALGVCDGQGSLACCSPWGHRESDMTEWLNWTEQIYSDFVTVLWVWVDVYSLNDILLTVHCGFAHLFLSIWGFSCFRIFSHFWNIFSVSSSFSSLSGGSSNTNVQSLFIVLKVSEVLFIDFSAYYFCTVLIG